MSLFKKSKPENSSEEMNMKREEMLLPDVMTMSYSEFVAIERNNIINPIRNELKAQENRRIELQNLYSEAVKQNDTITAKKVSEVLHDTVKNIDNARNDLLKAELTNPVDIIAQELAFQLDRFIQYERLYELYIQITQNINKLLALAQEADTLARYCNIDSSTGNITSIFQNQILYNIDHDLKYKIKKPDKAALLKALNNRLYELKVESDKNKSLDEKFKSIE